MTWLDRFIQKMRIKKATTIVPEQLDRIFDIGCDDQTLLSELQGRVGHYCGCDPRVPEEIFSNTATILKGTFPEIMLQHPTSEKFDAIFALAVFEHFAEEDLLASASVIATMLKVNGKLIVTVPDPKVDLILKVLIKFKLIVAQAFEEHHGFGPNDLESVFSKHLVLVERKSFQFGLNNLFVFTKQLPQRAE